MDILEIAIQQYGPFGLVAYFLWNIEKQLLKVQSELRRLIDKVDAHARK